MDEKITLSNVRVAGAPTFFPHQDPKKHRTLLTVIKNRGKNRNTGAPMSDEFTLVFWGKYAQTAALYLDKGRAINVECVPRTRSIDTGIVKANGKKQILRITDWHVRSFEFGPDSMKELSGRINGNIMKAKQAGLLDANSTITAEYLLQSARPTSYDYNPELAAQTGMYGNAKVYIKGQGFMNAGAGAGNINISVNSIQALEEELARKKAALEANKTLAAGAGEAVNPFQAAS